jgi:hypothetical protein
MTESLGWCIENEQQQVRMQVSPLRPAAFGRDENLRRVQTQIPRSTSLRGMTKAKRCGRSSLGGSTDYGFPDHDSFIVMFGMDRLRHLGNPLPRAWTKYMHDRGTRQVMGIMEFFDRALKLR